MMPKADRQNIAWIDPCKGLGIYLVVLGHANINSALQHFIYLFHMPLFFFLSGYLHTTRTDLGGFFRKKAIHLLVPYAAFLVLLYPLGLVRVMFHHGFGPALGYAFFAALWGGARLQGLYGVFWFLPCLFMTQQVMNLLLARFRWRTIASVVFIAALLSYLNADLAPQLSLPLDTNVVPAAMPLFYLGFLARTIPAKLHSILVVIAGLGAALGAYLEHLAVPVFYDMRAGVYGIPGLSLILAVCCIVCLIAISQWSTMVVALRKLLTRLGAASMGIMFIHKQLPVFPALSRWAEGHGYAASLLFTAISWLISELLCQSMLTRALLLGSEADSRQLAQWRRMPATSRMVRTHAPSRI